MEISVARVNHFDCLADWYMRQEIHDLVGFLNRVTVEAGHDIATDQTGLVRRPAGRLDVFEGGAAVSRVEIIDADVRAVLSDAHCNRPADILSYRTHQSAAGEENYERNPNPGRTRKAQAAPPLVGAGLLHEGRVHARIKRRGAWRPGRGGTWKANCFRVFRGSFAQAIPARAAEPHLFGHRRAALRAELFTGTEILLRLHIEFLFDPAAIWTGKNYTPAAASWLRVFLVRRLGIAESELGKRPSPTVWLLTKVGLRMQVDQV